MTKPGLKLPNRKGGDASLPYPPSWVDRLMAWIDRLPGPPWLFYLAAFLAGAYSR